ncbi:MAG: CoA pyrophosphatase [Piscirickettsiaceae bacterium]|nr:MAG: CoA pyrophosphatase [Piscirickettsiaceae bacterium]PCI70339.1 MAG: CoA pyrophosphatase [Piscirickettsiaceae bacterium]
MYKSDIIQSIQPLSVINDWNHDAREDGLRNAAVLVPLVMRDEWHVILTKRTDHLHHHPGQVSFPGGRADAIDVSPIDTALRETEEEIGVQADLVEVVGVIEPLITVTDFSVTPLVGFVDPAYELDIDAFEVAEVFEVPLSLLLDLSKYERKEILWQGKNRYFWEVKYDGHQIWGATAAMLYTFAGLVNRE